MLTSAHSTEAQTEFVTFGAVHLDIVAKARSVAWWRDVVGLGSHHALRPGSARRQRARRLERDAAQQARSQWPTAYKHVKVAAPPK